MKITDGKGLLDPKVICPEAIQGGGGRKAVGSTSQARDRVSVSAAARDLARLREEVGSVDAVRESRVAELRTAVATGQYRVDAFAVARSVLRDLMSDQVQ